MHGLMRGLIEQMGSNEQKGLDAYINHAIPLSKKSEDNFVMANANKFVGISLLNANERKKANVYLQNALDLFEKSSTESEAIKKEAIVEIFLILAENNIYLNLDSAKIYLDKANEILKQYPGSNAYLFYYFPEGMYHMKRGRYREAITSFDKGIALPPGAMQNFYINRTKFSKSEALREMKEYPQAINVIKNLLKSSILLDSDRSAYYNLIANTYAGAGNMREAMNGRSNTLPSMTVCRPTATKRIWWRWNKNINQRKRKNKLRYSCQKKRK